MCGKQENPIQGVQSEETDEAKLVDLAKRYQLFKETLDRIGQLSAAKKDSWSEGDELEYQASVDPIACRLYGLAWDAVSLKAERIEGLWAKASILVDWCGDRDDVKDALAQSLCADLRMRALQAQCRSSSGPN